jgi:hypothetical protein
MGPCFSLYEIGYRLARYTKPLCERGECRSARMGAPNLSDLIVRELSQMLLHAACWVFWRGAWTKWVPTLKNHVERVALWSRKEQVIGANAGWHIASVCYDQPFLNKPVSQFVREAVGTFGPMMARERAISIRKLSSGPQPATVRFCDLVPEPWYRVGSARQASAWIGAIASLRALVVMVFGPAPNASSLFHLSSVTKPVLACGETT